MPIKISHEDYEKALERGRRELERPHVVDARYVRAEHMLDLRYSTGLVLRFDPRTIDLFADLPEEALTAPYVTPSGDGLIFDGADVSVSIPGLIAKLIPVDIAQSVVASARGRVTSEAKAEAARANGLKGGRPPKRFS